MKLCQRARRISDSMDLQGVYPLATGDYTMVADCDDGRGLAVYVNPDCPVVDVQGEYSADAPGCIW